MTYQILKGNSLDLLPTLADNSIDAIVTDPPYELGFMGKTWDNSGIAYSVELWQQCLRVLKPGGHLLAFSGSRTYHRMVVSIEDAGFEIRDMISWISNKTFPKSLNISKAIDKGTGENKQRQLKFVSWMKSTGITPGKCDEILKLVGHISQTSSHSIHYFNYGQPQIATADTFDILRPYLPEVPEEIERLVAERTGIDWTAYKNRKVLGKSKGAQSDSTGKFGGWGNDDGTGKSEYNLTASATDEAKKWEGWGTGLKPTVEPIVMARKPVEGTVANNVLTYGTGGLNIDASRIGSKGGTARDGKANLPNDSGWANMKGHGIAELNAGRWPANLILDEYTAELLDEQSGIVSKKGGTYDYVSPHNPNSTPASFAQGMSGHRRFTVPSETGGASRFFYVAKASKRDRNEGLEELIDTTAADMVDREPDSAGMNSPRAGAGRKSGAKNFHPTVKPTELMRYLVKLITPPGGTVLDPFTGSGSTGKAAILEGFDFIGIELTEDYWPIIEGRLKHAEAKVAERIKETSDQEQEKLF